MEHDNLKESENQVENLVFFKASRAKLIFGRLDYDLKSGKHIQYQHPDQEEHFNFLKRYYESIRGYYAEYFGVYLEKGGIDPDVYYYLDFEEGSRGDIPSDRREFIDPAHLIIGIFVCKVYNIDFHSDTSSIKTFKRLMMEEYEEYKADFFRLLSEVRNPGKELHLSEDEQILENSIRAAFREFEKLGWIYFRDKSKENFIVLPSFERLRKLYAQEINSPRQLAEKYRKQL